MDIVLKGGDLFIDPATGDFAIGPSDYQHIADNLNAFPGWWKENPADGVGIFAYSGGTNTQELARAIKLQLVADGYVVDNPIIGLDNRGNLTIQPNATRP